MINRVYHMHAVVRSSDGACREFFALAKFKSFFPDQEKALRKMMGSARKELELSETETLIVTSFSRC